MCKPDSKLNYFLEKRNPSTHEHKEPANISLSNTNK